MSDTQKHVVSSYGAPSQNGGAKQQQTVYEEPQKQEQQQYSQPQQTAYRESGNGMNRTLIMAIAGVIIAAIVILAGYRIVSTLPTAIAVQNEAAQEEEVAVSDTEAEKE